MNDRRAWPVGIARSCAARNKEEATDCYRKWLLDNRLRLNGKNAAGQYKCKECGEWTQGYAECDTSIVILCDAHRTRAVFEKHFPRFDQVISAGNNMILTWSDLVRWAKIDPGALMGVKVGECEAFDTDRQKRISSTPSSLPSWTLRQNSSATALCCGQRKAASASAPYFRLPDYQEPGYILERHLDTTVTITPSSSCPKHRTVATITATMDPPGVDERAATCACGLTAALRLETELINVDVQRGVLHWTYTIQAEALELHRPRQPHRRR